MLIVYVLNNMKIYFNTSRDRLGFSLAEVVASLTIAAMILVAVLGIYSRAEKSASAITHRLDSSRLPSEILQRIAEDLDGIITAGVGTRVTINNRFDRSGYSTTRLEILKTIYDNKRGRSRAKTFEKIVWQSSYDNDTDSLALYRSHSGIGLEDKLLDEKRADWEKAYPFVPFCTGITFFKIQVPKGEDFQNNWTNNSLPHGIVATISFAEPFKALMGTLDVPDEEKIMRTITIDRTRKIRFIFVKKEFEDDEVGKEVAEEGKEQDQVEEDKEQSEVEEGKEQGEEEREERVKEGRNEGQDSKRPE